MFNRCDILDSLTKEVIKLSITAGKMMLKTMPVISKFKGTKENYVTETDEMIQEFLKKNLLSILPESSFMGEENCEYCKGSLMWIVDPIDGTVNYARGLSTSVVSVALVKDEEVILGVVHNPYLKETFHAERSNGAYLNKKPIHVSNTPREHSIISTAWSAYNKKLAHMSFRISERLHTECADIRRFGASAYEMCLLAKGSIDMYFEMLLCPWDHAAAGLIVKEAGGYSSSLDGPLNLFDQCPVLAANNKENFDYLKSTIIEELKDIRPEGSIWGEKDARK